MLGLQKMEQLKDFLKQRRDLFSRLIERAQHSGNQLEFNRSCAARSEIDLILYQIKIIEGK